MLSIEFSRQARKFLEKCDPGLRERILAKIRPLATEPVPHNAIRIVGEERTFRIRVGDYRVLYEISWKESEILVAVVDKRPRAYG